MQTKIKILLALIVMSITASSCDDYLDLRPQDGIIREEFWKTKEDVRAAVIGIYSSMLNSPPGVGDLPLSKYLFMYGELRGDMVSPGTNVTEDERDIMNTNILASNSLTSWAAFYRTINYCNTVIDLAPDVINEDPTLTQEQLNKYLSEALAVRGYLYFTLARTFRDVPLKLNASLSDQDNFQLPKNTQAEIFEQVIKDLKQAEEYGVETYGDQASNNGRITKDAINAILTDVYLWTGNYQEALTAADKVVNSGKYSLIQASNNTWFNRVFAVGNSTESIFEFQYTVQNKGPFYTMFLQRPEFIASATVLEDVFGIDYGDAENKDIRGERASLVPGTNQIYKYVGLNNDVRKELESADTHWFVYRYADVLLMKAEALAELGQGEEAVAIIDEIRASRNAIEFTAKTVDVTNKFDIIDYILEERAREFAYEGKRWYDVLRNARKNNYERLQILIDMAMVNAPPDQQQSIVNKLKDPNSHYLPINTYELYSNKALVQNPFYK
ncbi:RagB/SusD family nutrient uptake outer membrane protein [Flavobacterium agrisoli]|uniref:RagB/SusD family nutrient uptake outer membrane protein n=1 Tax=Flavobacterium agrisoli TaxID=2793066 RepID=A0A934PPK3_9FLAO|nr:RagB/SusD family nutrient uptake outer membrane protein [Flavobacterium agrisoli]MBK0370700.1 RagB/SusD family nutrient uptake outer membrane protein [Flavobacterium agrisoli]